MIHKWILVAVFSLWISSTWAQPLNLDKQVLNFGDVIDTTTDSLSISLSNPYDYPVEVDSIYFFKTYSQADFWASETSMTIPAQGSHSIWVYFNPRHNISYNSEMVIRTQSGRGSLAVNLRGSCNYANQYYASTFNKTEEALKSSLKSIITAGMSNLSYNQARDHMFMDIDNQAVNGQGAPVNTIEGAYTGMTVTDYNNRSEAQNAGFNTEHTFPQSFYNQNLPMRADIHHLFPTNANANSERANKPFNEVSNPSWSVGGSHSNSAAFEPRDVQKGKTARAMMYFVTRYQDYNGFMNGQEAILRQWNRDFPPDAVEKSRNDLTFVCQGNRNPFIDYPQFTERIFSLTTTSSTPLVQSIFVSNPHIEFKQVGIGQEVIYTLSLVNAGNVAVSIFNLALSHPSLSFGGNSGSDTSIEPGESQSIQIQLNASQLGELTDTLQIESNTFQQSLIKVPISASIETSNSTEGLAAAQVHIYPQPALDVLKIERKNFDIRPIQLQLYDVQGSLLLSQNMSQSVTELNMKTFAQGLYILDIDGYRHKVLKQ